MSSSSNRRILFNDDARFSLSEPSESKRVTLTGYGMIWGAVSSDRGGYRVRLLPGSARFTDQVVALYSHQFSDIVGNTENQTLRITPDNIGVRLEIDLPDTTVGRDVAVLVRDRYLSGMSFGAISDLKGKRVKEGGLTILEASDLLVDEFSVVAAPSFTETSIGIKPDAEFAERIRQRHAFDRLRFSILSCV